MEEGIRRIAKENISTRKKAVISFIVFVSLFCVFFAYSVEHDFQYIPSIVGFVVSPILGVLIANYYSKKVIGKKTALDHEVERLKALHPEEKLELPEIDDAELKLKDMVRRSNTDDMV